MKDQHTKIKGYRDLTQDEINLMNKIKLHGQVLDELINEVKLHVASQRAAARNLPADEASDEIKRIQAAEPERWAALARTEFQQALMALTRSVAQPTSF
jgi:predicted Zn-dependent peptidase